MSPGERAAVLRAVVEVFDADAHDIIRLNELLDQAIGTDPIVFRQPRRPNMTADTWDAIKLALRDGCSAPTIARRLNVGLTLVYHVKNGHKLRPKEVA